MKITEHNDTVLNPKWEECGFMVGKYEDPLCYANMKTPLRATFGKQY